MQSYNSQRSKSPYLTYLIRKTLNKNNDNLDFCEISRKERAEILQAKISCMNILVLSAIKAAEDAVIAADSCWDKTPVLLNLYKPTYS